MSRELDFTQIDAIGEFLEVKDYDLFISLLTIIKAFFDEKARADSATK